MQGVASHQQPFGIMNEASRIKRNHPTTHRRRRQNHHKMFNNKYIQRASERATFSNLSKIHINYSYPKLGYWLDFDIMRCIISKYTQTHTQSKAKTMVAAQRRTLKAITFYGQLNTFSYTCFTIYLYIYISIFCIIIRGGVCVCVWEQHGRRGGGAPRYNVSHLATVRCATFAVL